MERVKSDYLSVKQKDKKILLSGIASLDPLIQIQ